LTLRNIKESLRFRMQLAISARSTYMAGAAAFRQMKRTVVL
jgi:hypothetical protein